MTVEKNRRKKTLPLEGGGGGVAGSDIPAKIAGATPVAILNCGFPSRPPPLPGCSGPAFVTIPCAAAFVDVPYLVKKFRLLKLGTVSFDGTHFKAAPPRAKRHL